MPDQQIVMNQQTGYIVGDISKATQGQIIAKVELEKQNRPYIEEAYWRNFKPTIIFRPEPEYVLSSPITDLTNDDITKTQSYPQYDTMREGQVSYTLKNGIKVQVPPTEYYLSFDDTYAKDPGNCEACAKMFSPDRLKDYQNAKVEWLTNPKLIYRAANNRESIRGILSTFFMSVIRHRCADRILPLIF